MEYQYVAYTEDRRLVKGRLSATSEETANDLLSYGGYQVVSLKTVTPFFNIQKLLASFSRVKPRDVIMFSRQLALLLESGTDIVASLELLQSQVANNALRRILGEIISDIRGGSSVSLALSKHPRAFPEIYYRTIAVGEQGGNLEIVLRQMANYFEKGVVTEKKIKNALTYPFIVAVVAVIVIAVLVTYVFPTFISLYTSFGTEVPVATKILMNATDWFSRYGLYLLLGIVVAAALGFVYIRTSAGKYQWHSLLFRLPVLGPINLFNELARCCRTIALLFRVGLPLPEIMTMAVQSSKNKVMVEALTEVQQEMIRGEGLSKPMARRKLFLPLMVQMAGVGEETGNLDNALDTVAESYEVEADDRTTSAVGLIQPTIIVVIALIVGFVAISLVSAMYSMYGQFGS